MNDSAAVSIEEVDIDELPIGRTMKAVHMAQLRGDTIFPKAGELVEMQFESGTLGTSARKVLLLLLQRAGSDAWRDQTFTIRKRELRGNHDSNDRIRDVLDELMNVKVRLRTTSKRNRPAILTSSLMEYHVEELADDGSSLVEWKFSEAARVAIQGSDYYAQIKVAVVGALTSKYAISLYEMGALLLRRRDRTWKGTIDELRAQVGVPPGIYTNSAILRREVLVKAKAEIDQLADFTMDWTEIRGTGRGRPLESVILEFTPKADPQIEAAADEIDRPKVGRGARRDGSVENIARGELPDNVARLEVQPAFPTSSLTYCSDERLTTIVRQHGGGWDRDLVAAAFRENMGERLGKLRGERMYSAWEGFCKKWTDRRGIAR